jgi:hypothetical protein
MCRGRGHLSDPPANIQPSTGDSRDSLLNVDASNSVKQPNYIARTHTHVHTHTHIHTPSPPSHPLPPSLHSTVSRPPLALRAPCRTTVLSARAAGSGVLCLVIIRPPTHHTSTHTPGSCPCEAYSHRLCACAAHPGRLRAGSAAYPPLASSVVTASDPAPDLLALACPKATGPWPP